MNFNEWIVWQEALDITGIESDPIGINLLRGGSLDKMSDREIETLARWHGVWGTPTRNLELQALSPIDQARARIRHRREARISSGMKGDPSPEEVKEREHGNRLRRGVRSLAAV